MRLLSLILGVAVVASLTQPSFAASDDNEIVATYFVRLRQFATRCASSDAVDRAWCDAYIAGVVDTIGSNRRLQEDQQAARCLRGKLVSLSQVRSAVQKAVDLAQEDKNPLMLNAAAMNSVVAGVVVYLCN
jgi:hypothetical protein